MRSDWPTFREPLGRTLARTGIIAIVAGAILARRWGGMTHWPMTTLLAFWISFGGHWVEVWFLNWLRPRVPTTRVLQVVARLATWFAGGILLGAGMRLTAILMTGIRLPHWPAWWFAGLGFIGIELVVHLILQLRGRPSFYNGRG